MKIDQDQKFEHFAKSYRLGDIAKVVRGERVTKAQLSDGYQYPVISGGTRPLGYFTRYNRSSNVITIAQYGTAGYIDWQNQAFWANDVCYCIYPNELILNRFLYYSLLNQQEHIFELKTNAIPAHLPIESLVSVKITIPSLEIQKEIVRILDTFTELEAELEAELETRIKQYSYYKKYLLSDEIYRNCEEFSLFDIAYFRNGKGHESCIVDKSDYIVVNSKFISANGNVIKTSDSQLSPLYRNDIALVMSDLPNGKALGKCYLIESDGKYTLNQRIGAITTKNEESVKTKYLYYQLNRNRQLLRYDNGVDQTNLKKNEILEILVSVPPIEIQERVIHILDQFDTLVNDISQGLPAEIAARRKQYEYYRNKLLTFKEVANESV
jgi:type I restriction enzyme S subunit